MEGCCEEAEAERRMILPCSGCSYVRSKQWKTTCVNPSVVTVHFKKDTTYTHLVSLHGANRELKPEAFRKETYQ